MDDKAPAPAAGAPPAAAAAAPPALESTEDAERHRRVCFVHHHLDALPARPQHHNRQGATPRPRRKKRRRARGEPKKMVRGASGLGSHVPLGGHVADFGPVDTERMSRQRDERDIEARVP